jgi:hypothetical protein
LNCGACGNACPANTSCVGGQCAATGCPEGKTTCAGTCVDLQTDVNNCGLCGHSCSFANATAACVNGVCVIGTCNAGFGNCDGNQANGCEADLTSDVNNCGACGNGCSFPHASATCVQGTCQMGACAAGFDDCDNDPSNGCETDLNRDPTNCGACGNVCPTGQVCDAGTCSRQTCGAVGEACCERRNQLNQITYFCSAGAVCNGFHVCVPCGETGQVCCPSSNSAGGMCNNGTCAGQSDVCVACGAPGQPCCGFSVSVSPCHQLQAYCDQSTGVCVACGAPGQGCCPINSGIKCDPTVAICQGSVCVACGDTGQPCCPTRPGAIQPGCHNGTTCVSGVCT